MGKSAYSTVYGSPGTRVRFAGFFRLFIPLLVFVFLVGVLAGRLFGPQWIPDSAAGLAIIFLIITSWLVYDSAARRFEHFLKGAKGEEIVARELAMLPSGWFVFHGIPIDGSGGAGPIADFDHIVVGPPGIIIVETKNWSARVTVENGRIRCGGRPPSRSPVVQIRREAERLARMLSKDAPGSTRIRMVVCIAADTLEGGYETIDDVAVCNGRSLREKLLSMPHSPLPEDYRTLVVQKLASMVV